MKFLYSWLKDYVPVKESPEKLAELLSSTSFETVVARRLGADAVFEVGLLPNRVADASSHFGVAREIALVKGRKLEFTMKQPDTGGTDIRKSFSCKVSAKTGCRRYMLAAMTGIKVKSSPQWLKKRLLACGVRPINNVVDAANYVMLELGQPLHAFDAEKIAGKRIMVRPARQGETIETIEKKVYALSEQDVLIADTRGPLALAGVKGGRRAEISAATKNIVIESANFDPASTRATAKRHALKTDASWRFENGLDPNTAEIALWRVVTLIKELTGGEGMTGALDYYPKKVLPMPVAVSAEKVSRLIGQDIPASRIMKLVAPFCRSVKKTGRDTLFLKVETYRRDIKHFEDVAEEVARLVGYNEILAVPPVAVLIPARKNEELMFRERLRDELASLGFSETYNYSFIGDDDVLRLHLPKDQLIELANPTSNEYRYLRRMLYPNLLKNARDNLRFFPEVRMFEIGKQYKRVSARSSEESWRLAAVIARMRGKPADIFSEAKGALESLLERVGFDRDDYRFGPPAHTGSFYSSLDTFLFIDGMEVGRIDLVSPEETAAYGIDGIVACFGLEIGRLQRAVAEEHEFEPLHKYPDVIRDISILVPAFTKVEDVEDVIENAGAKYLEDTDLFDVYDEGLPGDQASMAFHLIFRAPDRTLTDKEVKDEMEKIVTALKAIGAQIR